MLRVALLGLVRKTVFGAGGKLLNTQAPHRVRFAFQFNALAAYAHQFQCIALDFLDGTRPLAVACDSYGTVAVVGVRLAGPGLAAPVLAVVSRRTVGLVEAHAVVSTCRRRVIVYAEKLFRWADRVDACPGKTVLVIGQAVFLVLQGPAIVRAHFVHFTIAPDGSGFTRAIEAGAILTELVSFTDGRHLPRRPFRAGQNHITIAFDILGCAYCVEAEPLLANHPVVAVLQFQAFNTEPRSSIAHHVNALAFLV